MSGQFGIEVIPAPYCSIADWQIVKTAGGQCWTRALIGLRGDVIPFAPKREYWRGWDERRIAQEMAAENRDTNGEKKS